VGARAGADRLACEGVDGLACASTVASAAAHSVTVGAHVVVIASVSAAAVTDFGRLYIDGAARDYWHSWAAADYRASIAGRGAKGVC
jgi:hypothetical protein